jgi:hypothetical protein
MNIFQESNGDYSLRRFIAFVSWIAGAVLSFLALPYASAGWFVFLPALTLFGLSALMPMLTTIADIKALAETVKGLK